MKLHDNLSSQSKSSVLPSSSPQNKMNETFQIEADDGLSEFLESSCSDSETDTPIIRGFGSNVGFDLKSFDLLEYYCSDEFYSCSILHLCVIYRAAQSLLDVSNSDLSELLEIMYQMQDEILKFGPPSFEVGIDVPSSRILPASDRYVDLSTPSALFNHELRLLLMSASSSFHQKITAENSPTKSSIVDFVKFEGKEKKIPFFEEVLKHCPFEQKKQDSISSDSSPIQKKKIHLSDDHSSRLSDSDSDSIFMIRDERTSHLFTSSFLNSLHTLLYPSSTEQTISALILNPLHTENKNLSSALYGSNGNNQSIPNASFPLPNADNRLYDLPQNEKDYKNNNSFSFPGSLKESEFNFLNKPKTSESISTTSTKSNKNNNTATHDSYTAAVDNNILHPHDNKRTLSPLFFADVDKNSSDRKLQPFSPNQSLSPSLLELRNDLQLLHNTVAASKTVSQLDDTTVHGTQRIQQAQIRFSVSLFLFLILKNIQAHATHHSPSSTHLHFSNFLQKAFLEGVSDIAAPLMGFFVSIPPLPHQSGGLSRSSFSFSSFSDLSDREDIPLSPLSPKEASLDAQIEAFIQFFLSHAAQVQSANSKDSRDGVRNASYFPSLSSFDFLKATEDLRSPRRRGSTSAVTNDTHTTAATTTATELKNEYANNDNNCYKIKVHYSNTHNTNFKSVDSSVASPKGLSTFHRRLIKNSSVFHVSSSIPCSPRSVSSAAPPKASSLSLVKAILSAIDIRLPSAGETKPLIRVRIRRLSSSSVQTSNDMINSSLRLPLTERLTDRVMSSSSFFALHPHSSASFNTTNGTITSNRMVKIKPHVTSRRFKTLEPVATCLLDEVKIPRGVRLPSDQVELEEVCKTMTRNEYTRYHNNTDDHHPSFMNFQNIKNTTNTTFTTTNNNSNSHSSFNNHQHLNMNTINNNHHHQQHQAPSTFANNQLNPILDNNPVLVENSWSALPSFSSFSSSFSPSSSASLLLINQQQQQQSQRPGSVDASTSSFKENTLLCWHPKAGMGRNSEDEDNDDDETNFSPDEFAEHLPFFSQQFNNNNNNNNDARQRHVMNSPSSSHPAVSSSCLSNFNDQKTLDSHFSQKQHKRNQINNNNFVLSVPILSFLSEPSEDDGELSSGVSSPCMTPLALPVSTSFVDSTVASLGVFSPTSPPTFRSALLASSSPPPCLASSSTCSSSLYPKDPLIFVNPLVDVSSNFMTTPLISHRDVVRTIKKKTFPSSNSTSLCTSSLSSPNVVPFQTNRSRNNQQEEEEEDEVDVCDESAAASNRRISVTLSGSPL